MSSVIVVNKENFDEEVIKSEKLVLVDFYADWCGPCKMSAPHIEALANEYLDKVKVVKINTENDPELAAKYGVFSIPTFLVLNKGELVKKVSGAKNKIELEEIIGL